MRFTALFFAGLAVAQVQVILDTLNGISGQTQDLDNAILAFNGGSAAPIITASQKLVQATTSGTDTINALQPVSLNDAVKIQAVVKSLTTTVEKAINDLIAKKSVDSSNNLGGVTYQQLQDQYKGADSISKAITTKVPTNLQQVATTLSQGILKAIQKGIDAYTDIKDQVAPASATAGATTGSATTATGGNGTISDGGMGSNSTAPRTTHAPLASTPSVTAPATTPAASSGAGAPLFLSSFKPAGALVAVAMAAFAL